MKPKSRAPCDYALDLGVNHFDNADVYGNGRAERMLARVLGARSQRVLIATKVGHFPRHRRARVRGRSHPSPVRAVPHQPEA